MRGGWTSQAAKAEARTGPGPAMTSWGGGVTPTCRVGVAPSTGAGSMKGVYRRPSSVSGVKWQASTATSQQPQARLAVMVAWVEGREHVCRAG